jgi:hypothetical protein
MASNTFYRYDTWVKSSIGPAVPGAQIWVCTQPANTATVPPSPLAAIYSDSGGLVPIVQPLLTDGFGHADFYTLPGLYTVIVALGGVIQAIYPDQSIGGVGTTGGGSGTPSGTLLLQSNGISNANQFVLNLQSQDGSVTITNDSSGNTNLKANTAQFSGNASFMFGPGIRDLGTVFGGNWGAPQANSVAGVVTANKVTVYLFQLDVAITISKASVTCTNNTIGPTASFGIYSFSGNKLVDAGSFNLLTSPTVQVNTFSSVTLPPGIYWHAQACTTTGTATFAGIVVSNGANNDSIPAYVKNATRCATAANLMSGGVLPATLGALTPFTPLSTQGDGFCAPLYE